MKVKCVYIFLAFSSFVRVSLEAWVCSYPKMKASTALVLYHTHCAFNQLAEMESGKDEWEKDWQAALTLPQKPWQCKWELWPWPALDFIGMWLTYYLLLVMKISLEHISLWPFIRATISPYRIFVQMVKRNHFAKTFYCHLLYSCNKYPNYTALIWSVYLLHRTFVVLNFYVWTQQPYSKARSLLPLKVVIRSETTSCLCTIHNQG